MAQVQTVRVGAVDSSQLGTTLMHETIFVLTPRYSRTIPKNGEAKSSRRRYNAPERTQGQRRGHDCRPHGDRPGSLSPQDQADRAADRINIIVATGIYTYHDAPLYFHFRGPGTVLGGPEPIMDMFVRDINEGIAGTGVKAAILKCATDEPGVTRASSEICAPSRRPTARPACPSLPIHTPESAWDLTSSGSFAKKESTCRAL